jgi:diguanylate cyclase (GGDEF)-like protein
MVEALASAERARHDALTDALTGLANRRHLDVALEGRLENLARYGWSFGLLMVDVDHFKLVNDEHGHDAGDAVLRTVAATLAGGVRSGDLAARWGGEEFAVLVEAADGPALLEVAERLRVLVARSTARHGELALAVTVSIGGAVATVADSAASLVVRADATLYRAKRDGRNRVAIMPTPTSVRPAAGSTGRRRARGRAESGPGTARRQRERLPCCRGVSAGGRPREP